MYAFETGKYFAPFIGPQALLLILFGLLILVIYMALRSISVLGTKKDSVTLPKRVEDRSLELENLRLLKQSVANKIETHLINWVTSNKMNRTLLVNFKYDSGMYMISVDTKSADSEKVVSIAIFTENSKVYMEALEPLRPTEAVSSDIDPKVDKLILNLVATLEKYYLTVISKKMTSI